jgi:hypothetical protein
LDSLNFSDCAFASYEWLNGSIECRNFRLDLVLCEAKLCKICLRIQIYQQCLGALFGKHVPDMKCQCRFPDPTLVIEEGDGLHENTRHELALIKARPAVGWHAASSDGAEARSIVSYRINMQTNCKTGRAAKAASAPGPRRRLPVSPATDAFNPIAIGSSSTEYDVPTCFCVEFRHRDLHVATEVVEEAHQPVG